MAKKQKRQKPHGPHLHRLVSVVAALALMGVAYIAHSYFFLRTPDLPRPSLKALAARRGVELGMLTYPDRLNDKPYRDILTSQYSFATADGPIHWDTSRPGPTDYDFAAMDKVVSFAQKHGMNVQGHHLVWDEDDSVPKWLKNGNYSQDQLRQYMHNHIRTVMNRYKGKVTSWTVVNEPFSRAEHMYGLDSWWRDRLGGNTDYIDDAFRWAREADPKAVLILNDFANETENSVSNAQYNYIKAAKARGVPIDAVGMQLHVDGSRPPSRVEMIRNMQRFAALGVPTYVTEFDVNMNSVKGDAAFKAREEARITADMARACVESKSCLSFIVFGITDKQDFLKRVTLTRSRSYFFTSRYEPKQSFYAFRDAWMQL